MLCGNDVPVSGGGYEHVGTRGSIFHGSDLITGHGGLKGIDGIDLGDEDTSTV